MIKLQDFARECGVTDRAIQKHLKTYANELDGLYQRKGPNGTWLTDEACEILRSKMKQTPPAVSDQQTIREKEALEKENKRLNEMLGSQGIIIGQMHQEICELQQFKIAALEERKLLEASREAQERRQQELLLREAAMDEEVRTAVQEATEAQRTALDELRAQEVKEARREAQEGLVQAQEAYEKDLRKKNEQIQAWEKYAADLEAYNSLGWFKRRKAVKPVPPMPPIEQED